jgi:hypothetical protein
MPDDKATFIITSVIHFSQKKLIGSAVRSVFSPEERTIQTIKTIKSIREKIPGATVILLEMGKEKNLANLLTTAADRYVYLGNKPLVRWSVNSKLRGFGEAMGLIAAAKELDSGTDFYFKISGRYFLTDEFKPGEWNGDRLVARKYGQGISTRLYGFARALFPAWQTALKRSLPQLYRGRSIEDVFPLKFGPEKIRDIKKLGLAGFVGPDGSLLEE